MSCRALLGAASSALLGGCAEQAGARRLLVPPPPAEGAFMMSDGTRLPYRAWLPDGPPDAVVLALHGINDSRDAWEYPGADFAAPGFALFAPDQRGFGATPGRGYWPGTGAGERCREMARLLRRRLSGGPAVLMGESMGARGADVPGHRPRPPRPDGYVLVAPAVWGRAEMNVFLRSGLWLAPTWCPVSTVTGAPVHVAGERQPASAGPPCRATR